MRCGLPCLDAVKSPIRFQKLKDIGFVAHPDGFAYADEPYSLYFPGMFRGSDHLLVRTFVNQISQIQSPVAHGVRELGPVVSTKGPARSPASLPSR